MPKAALAVGTKIADKYERGGASSQLVSDRGQLIDRVKEIFDGRRHVFED